MTIVIPEFWAGVVLTILAEFVIILVYSVLKKDRKNREE